MQRLRKASERGHAHHDWLDSFPAQQGLPPAYEQRTFPAADRAGRLRLVVSPDGRGGSLTVHSDAALHAGVLGAGQTAELPLAPGRHAWIHVARGEARVNGRDLGAGDGLALSDEPLVQIEGRGGELLVFDLG